MRKPGAILAPVHMSESSDLRESTHRLFIAHPEIDVRRFITTTHTAITSNPCATFALKKTCRPGDLCLRVTVNRYLRNDEHFGHAATSLCGLRNSWLIVRRLGSGGRRHPGS